MAFVPGNNPCQCPHTHQMAACTATTLPRNWSCAICNPCTHQYGFPKAGGRRDARQFAVQTLVQLLDQVRTEDNLGSRRGNIEFCG